MKKKISMVVLAALATAMLFGCSSASTTGNASEASTEATTTTTEATTTTSATTTVKPLSESDFEIKDYICNFSYMKEDTFYVMVIKNNSTQAVSFSYNLVARDANDGAIGACDGAMNMLGPGEETVALGLFKDVTGVDHVSRNMTFKENDKLEPEIGKLEAEMTVNKKNVIVTVTNKGENAATNFYIYLLYFDKNGKLIDFSSADIDELLPGAATGNIEPVPPRVEIDTASIQPVEQNVSQIPEVQPVQPIETNSQQNNRSKKSNDALVKYIKKMGTTKLVIAAVIVVVVVVGIIALIVGLSKPKPEKGPGPQQVDTVSTLTKVVKNSSFSTYEVVYNGVCTVNNEKKPETVDYYVAYMATVKAGFDFKEIKITKDDETHQIIISLPPIELFEPKINIEDLDYIVVNKKVKTETISADAYKICKADVAEKAKNQNAIYKYAKENGERLIKGLVSPFLEKMEEQYTISFEWRETK